MVCPFIIRICPQCRKLLVLCSLNFNKDKDKKYGFSYKCKECKNNYDRKRNGSKLENCGRKRTDLSCMTEEEIKEIKRQKCREYHNENKEKIHKRQKKYREEHKEEMNEKTRKWRKENPEKTINYVNKRRIKEEQQGKGITKEQWVEMMDFFDWKCAYSGISLNKDNRSVDHIVALNEGGEHEIWNLVPMCKNYNSSKNTKDMFEWYKQQIFFDEDRLDKIYQWIEYSRRKWR